MAYTAGFENDIFVSFANNDNEAGRIEDQWVRRFVDELRIGIKNWLGDADDLKIFFEKTSTDGSFRHPMFLENARNSAIFLAVLSPSYVRRSWPRDELKAFCVSSGLGYLFAIECRPVDDRSLLPPELSELTPGTFFIQDTDSRAARPLLPENDARIWRNRIEELAKDVANRLRDRAQKAGSGTGVSPFSAQNTSNGQSNPYQTVLLAQATDDLAGESDDVRRYLTQAGYTVLPLQGIFSQGGRVFRDEFKAALSKSNCYVQLLGGAKARIDPELPAGYTRYQFETAKEAAITRPDLRTFFWRPLYLQVDKIEHDDAGLLADEKVVAMTLESFKKEIQSSMQSSSRSFKTKHSSSKSLTVFINAAREDFAIADAVSDECAKQGFTSILSQSENSALELFNQVKASFGICNAYLLVFGIADPLWAIRQGGYFNKISAQFDEPDLPKVIAILDGPPEEKNPPPIRLPRSKVLNCRSSLEPLRQILRELHQ